MTNGEKSARRQELYSLLGDLPSAKGAVSCYKLSEEEKEHYVLEKLILDLNGLEPVPAYFVKPKDLKGKAPTVLFNHAHGGNYPLGKGELLEGTDYSQKPPYAVHLTSMGYCALCIDTWAFGERRGRSEGEIFKQMLWSGQVMWGMMVFDSLRAIDYLVSRPEVDENRLATLGISMGSTMAWWVSALDERIKVCADICCMTDFESLIKERGLDGHGIYYYVPKLLKHFTATEINTLIAPRPHLSLNGIYDRLTPADGLSRIDGELKEVYQREGVPEAWEMFRSHTAHLETTAMRQKVLQFLEKWL